MCGLCKSVSMESAAEQDHMQLLAKLSSLASTGFAGKDAESQVAVEMVSCSPVCDPIGPPVGAPEAGAHAEETGSVPESLVSTCLDMSSSL